MFKITQSLIWLLTIHVLNIWGIGQNIFEICTISRFPYLGLLFTISRSNFLNDNINKNYNMYTFMYLLNISDISFVHFLILHLHVKCRGSNLDPTFYWGIAFYSVSDLKRQKIVWILTLYDLLVSTCSWMPNPLRYSLDKHMCRYKLFPSAIKCTDILP